ncbi:hypothetical protein G3M58_05455 [Streptomyces sp. SID7499]|uniref:Uncharacterized protein n=1 Tax=Streptomyces sp. SID7499 TaxID=2706086 RepID=A0A6G3WKB2_9ACTN|nr:hypothetical protein [Streptomyces sp. SID7499]
MTDLLRRLVAWAGLTPKPRRACRRALRETHLLTGVPSEQPLPLPIHRSPYRADTLIDGTSTRAVRPYLVVHEQRQARQQNHELGSATMELPVAGPYWPHGVEAA